MAAPVIPVENFGSTVPFCVIVPKDSKADNDTVQLFNRPAPVSIQDFDRLWASGTPSTYGSSDGTRVMDTDFRASREIDDVLLNPRFIDAVLAKVKSQWQNIQRLQFHRLLMYDEHGGFGLHVDQQRQPNMTHTIIINVPVEGGNEYEFVRSTPSIRHDEVVNIVGFAYDVPHAVRMIRCKRLCLVFHAISDFPVANPSNPLNPFAFGVPVPTVRNPFNFGGNPANIPMSDGFGQPVIPEPIRWGPAPTGPVGFGEPPVRAFGNTPFD